MTKISTVESIDDVREQCALIMYAVDELDGRGPLSPEDRIAAWHHLHATIDAAKVVLAQMAATAVEAMAQIGAVETETDVGPVHIAKGSKRTEWRGYAVLGLLSRQLLDRADGELIDAIPLDVARDVFGGCDSPDKKSANLLVGGLTKHGVRVDDYRTVSDAPLIIRPGPLPQALRPKRRRTTQSD